MIASLPELVDPAQPYLKNWVLACFEKKVQNYQVPFFLTLEGRFTFLHAYFLQTFILCQILGQSWCQK